MAKRRTIIEWTLAFLKVSAVLLLMGNTTVLAGMGDPSSGDEVIYLPLVHHNPSVLPPPPGDWLAYVNYYRALAELPGVVENPDYSYGDWLHSRYMVKNDDLNHQEDPSNPWYTQEGMEAGLSSNLAGGTYIYKGDEWAVDTWMQAPFHAIGILDPSLVEVGFGSYREPDGGLQIGAAIDVIRGLGSQPGIEFPVLWPAEGMIAPLRMHWGEEPSPLTSCPGYTTPAGLPIIVQIGWGEKTPHVTMHTFSNQSQALEHCVFDETNYRHPNRDKQDLGRAILDARDAVVLIPRAPLVSGESYTVSISINGETYKWTFSVDESLTGMELGMVGIAR